ncbi:MAG TPA: hypothetical protein VGF06_13680 [Terriglobales bacterium]
MMPPDGGVPVDIQEALKILRAMANGLEPETEKALPQDSICRNANVVKALNRGISALAQEEQRLQNRPANAFRSWTRAEDAQVCDEVRQGMDFHDIAKAHNRSVGSIVARLVKLGKITAQPSPGKVA